MGVSLGIRKRDRIWLVGSFADHAEADAALACEFCQISVQTLRQGEEELVVLAAVGGEVRSHRIAFVDGLAAWQ